MASPVAPASEARRPRAGQTERRAAERYICHLEVFCCPISRGFDLSWHGIVVNLSATGLCLQSTRRFESATFLSFEPDQPAGEAPPRLLGTVVQVRPDPSGHGWLIGCDFIRRLNERELQALLSLTGEQ